MALTRDLIVWAAPMNIVLWPAPRPPWPVAGFIQCGSPDVAAMNAAAQYLIGHHDFSTFDLQNARQVSALKTLDHLAVSNRGAEIVVTARAKSFLHHQVRLMVGSLIMVRIGALKIWGLL